jgi:hypothetical protein
MPHGLVVATLGAANLTLTSFILIPLLYGGLWSEIRARPKVVLLQEFRHGYGE